MHVLVQKRNCLNMSKVLEDELKNKGFIVISNKGNSMLPLIRQGKDLMVIVSKPNRRIRPLEAVFYRRGNKYLLHRVLFRRKNDYIIGADNRIYGEKGITDDDILGVLSAVIRDKNKEIKVQSIPYKFYVLFWYFIYPIRFIFMAYRLYKKRSH